MEVALSRHSDDIFLPGGGCTVAMAVGIVHAVLGDFQGDLFEYESDRWQLTPGTEDDISSTRNGDSVLSSSQAFVPPYATGLGTTAAMLAGQNQMRRPRQRRAMPGLAHMTLVMALAMMFAVGCSAVLLTRDTAARWAGSEYSCSVAGDGASTAPKVATNSDANHDEWEWASCDQTFCSDNSTDDEPIDTEPERTLGMVQTQVGTAGFDQGRLWLGDPNKSPQIIQPRPTDLRKEENWQAAYLHDICHSSLQKMRKTLGVVDGVKCNLSKDTSWRNCYACSVARRTGHPRLRSKNVVRFSTKPKVTVGPTASSLIDAGVLRGTELDAACDVIYNRAFDMRSSIGISAPMFSARGSSNRFLENADGWAFQTLFCDNKEILVPNQYGSNKVWFIVTDLFSTRIWVECLTSKKLNVIAWAKFVSQHQLLRSFLPVTLFHDGCGSMLEIARWNNRNGISDIPLPPGMGNHPGEIAVRKVVELTTCAVIHGDIPLKYYCLVGQMVAVLDSFIASTDSRGWRTPYELTTGFKPNLRNAIPPGTICFVRPKDSEKNSAKLSGPGVPRSQKALLGKVISIPDSRQPKCLLVLIWATGKLRLTTQYACMRGYFSIEDRNGEPHVWGTPAGDLEDIIGKMLPDSADEPYNEDVNIDLPIASTPEVHLQQLDTVTREGGNETEDDSESGDLDDKDDVQLLNFDECDVEGALDADSPWSNDSDSDSPVCTTDRVETEHDSDADHAETARDSDGTDGTNADSSENVNTNNDHKRSTHNYDLRARGGNVDYNMSSGSDSDGSARSNPPDFEHGDFDVAPENLAINVTADSTVTQIDLDDTSFTVDAIRLLREDVSGKVYKMSGEAITEYAKLTAVQEVVTAMRTDQTRTKTACLSEDTATDCWNPEDDTDCTAEVVGATACTSAIEECGSTIVSDPEWEDGTAETVTLEPPRRGKRATRRKAEYGTNSHHPSVSEMKLEMDKATRSGSNFSGTMEMTEAECDDILENVSSAAVRGTDLSYRLYLSKPEMREQVIVAVGQELDSLTSRCLVEIKPSDPRYENARRKAAGGRWLLDIKKSGVVKSRLVKQGFSEEKMPTRTSYTNLTNPTQVRMAIATPNERYKDRLTAVIDFKSAYSQGDPWKENEPDRYILARNPVTGKRQLFLEVVPIYGGYYGGSNWEMTLYEYLKKIGFVQGDNARASFKLTEVPPDTKSSSTASTEPEERIPPAPTPKSGPASDSCDTFHHPDGMMMHVYVDDALLDGSGATVREMLKRLRRRFKIKRIVYLSDNTPIDFLGAQIYQKQGKVYISMSDYIQTTVKELGLSDARRYSSPIDRHIIDDGAASAAEHRWFRKALGCLGWCTTMGRVDVRLAFQRLGHHAAGPTCDAIKMMRRCWGYLLESHWLCISADRNHRYSDYRDAWEFYSDSDYAGDPNPDVKRTAGQGAVAMFNGMPVLWRAGKGTIAMAHGDVPAGHADTSVAAYEIYALSEAVNRFVGLTYVAEESMIPCPTPIKVQVDNTAAIVFKNGTAQRSRLVHVDCRLHWVKQLRDSGVCTVVHVPSKVNLADLFTKVLSPIEHRRLTGMMMSPLPEDLRDLAMQF